MMHPSSPIETNKPHESVSEDDKTTDGAGEDDHRRRHAGRFRRETPLPDQRNRRMVPEIMRGRVQPAAHTGHRLQLDCEGGQAARHGTRHAGCPTARSGHRFGGQQQERFFLPSPQREKIIFSLVKPYTLYNLCG